MYLIISVCLPLFRKRYFVSLTLSINAFSWFRYPPSLPPPPLILSTSPSFCRLPLANILLTLANLTQIYRCHKPAIATKQMRPDYKLRLGKILRHQTFSFYISYFWDWGNILRYQTFSFHILQLHRNRKRERECKIWEIHPFIKAFKILLYGKYSFVWEIYSFYQSFQNSFVKR